jgi:O-glycosyl hydrolase
MKALTILFTVLITGMLLLSCGSPPKTGAAQNGGTVLVQYSEERQEIDGFGGSNAWLNLPYELGDEIVKLLYSKSEGAGFTILRNRIPFRERLSGDSNTGLNDNFLLRKSDNTYDFTQNEDGTKTFNLNWNSWDLSNTRNLISRIAQLGDDGPESLTVMSTPWTPPNNRISRWKPNVANWNTPEVGGRLDRSYYQDYADLLADYVGNFEAKMGAPLSILSVQNEPSYKCSYESADWSGEELRDFIIILGQRLSLKNLSGKTGIMAPEYQSFSDDIMIPTLASNEATSVLTHIGLHQYNSAYDPSGMAGSKIFPRISSSGKRFWQTEVSGRGPNMPAGEGIDNALFYARMIHYDMTLSETNAFLFWWFWGNTADVHGVLLTIVKGITVEPTMRFYAMGQFSRFIRPGWRRLSATPSPSKDIYSSAYRNPQSNEIAIVLINEKPIAAQVTVNLSDVAFSTLDLWRSSETEKLSALGKQKFSGNSVVLYLPPKSISTLFGHVKE